MRVLSKARVDRWRASSGQTPSSVTTAFVETTVACEAKARDGKVRLSACEWRARRRPGMGRYDSAHVSTAIKPRRDGCL